VKYLLIPIQVVLSPALAKLGVTKVFSGTLASVYQLPHPRGLFSTSASTCTVSSTDDNVAFVNCSTSGSTLLRRELSMKGWTATVNGKPATITTVDGVYQQIDVPSGTSVVDYRFFPPHERFAALAALLAGLFLIGSFVNERGSVLTRRGRHQY
jgi:hypothetical protein